MMHIFYIGIYIRIFFRFIRIGFLFIKEAIIFFIWREDVQPSFARRICKFFTYPFVKKPYNIGGRLRRSFEKLGPTFIKFGQILSTRWDILPQEVTKELEKLQSNVEPFRFEVAKKIIEKSFKKPLKKIFKKFNKKQVASASLGQVYEATLPTGERVAVKVQRPGAKKLITRDTSVLLGIVKLAESMIVTLKSYNLQGAVKEFRRWSLNELNYTLEGANADIFSQHFKNDPHVYSPKIYWDYTNKKVLTLEYIEGESLKTIMDLKGGKARKKKLVKYAGDSFIKQYFEFGFFHADPHPGNIFVKKNDVVYFLDFGMVGRLDPRLTELVANIFVSLLQKDIERIVQFTSLIHNEYSSKETADLEQSQINSFRKVIAELIDQWYGVTDKKHSFTRLFYDLVQASVNNGFFLPVDVIMIAKSIVTLDSVAKSLDPDFALSNYEKSLIEQMVKKRLDPERIANQTRDTALAVDRMIAKLPQYSEIIEKKFLNDHGNDDINPHRFAEYESNFSRSVDARSLSIVVAALFIGSVILQQSVNEQLLFGIKLSLIGFILSFILLLKVLFNLRKGEN